MLSTWLNNCILAQDGSIYTKVITDFDDVSTPIDEVMDRVFEESYADLWSKSEEFQQNGCPGEF